MTGTMLITGAAKRIGAALAKGMGEQGWHVCVHYNSSKDEAESVAKEIIDAEGQATALQADLADPTTIGPLVAACNEAAGPLTCLVNNASIFEYDALDSLDAETLDKHHAVNLRAPMLLARAFAAGIPDGETGNIINILDNKVLSPNPDYLSYTLSKFGLKGATETLAMALAPAIRVNAIAPGITLLSGEQSETRFEKAHATNPLNQGCTPDQIVAALKLILDCPAMTGEIITIDGGQRLQKLPRDIAFLT
ncbi:MAG TPA: short chain dehydrogenase [Rhodospirillaceae bacterium]|nr:short chain dehydrogenase [Rhodospirillaceae bacterium]HAA91764.1 short chain dehydrogenase [Rhodospirillaceae bacterium]HAT36387.1 short chain dehydrogenase [Rhodospirillaceae bacterium]